ncbi:MAG: hypothetical protein GEV11_15455 [Streptosporangiales bacterium]|nr:hypothetical protein [Streptosporangiales bacterium]
MMQDAVHGQAESGEPGSQLGHNPEGGTLVAASSHRGRVLSWVVVTLVIGGFAVGGIGLTLGVNQVMIGVGVVAIVIGGLVGAASDIFADVVLDSPRVLPELAHTRKGRAKMRTTGRRDAIPELAENTEKPRLR